jgi:hypothetical protein
VSVCRGGRRLAKARHHLEDAGLSEPQWWARWQTERLFLTADGEADKHLGNETIRVHPEEGWLELKLPRPLAHLANRLHGRYRLSCPVRFSHRGEEWAAQVASGAVRYDIQFTPDRGRWYVAASWRLPAPPEVTVQQAVASGVLAVDLNAGHLACWQIDRHGNPVGVGVNIPLLLDGASASTHDGRLRAAISTLLDLARQRAAAPSASKTSGSRMRGTPAGRRLVAGGAASASAARSPPSPPGSSATGWCRWPPTAASRWWLSTPAGPPSGARPTGGGPSKPSTNDDRSPGITRPAWCSGVARSGCGRGDGQVCPHPTSGWKPPLRGLVWRATGQAAPTPGRVQGTTRPQPAPAAARELHKTGSGDRTRADVQVVQDRSVPPISADRR